jgi:hypothetical protein
VSWRSKLIWSCIIVLGVFGISIIGHSVWEIAAKNQQKSTPHELPTAEVQHTDTVDETKAQPVTQVFDGTGGVNYDTIQAKATPKPAEPEQEPAAKPATELANLVLCDVAPTPRPTPKAPDPRDEEKGDYWLAKFHYIPVITNGEMDSSHMTSPMVFTVTRNVYQLIHGKSYLCIPAYSRIAMFAKKGYLRDRVEFEGKCTLLYVTEGTEVEFEGVACDQEYNPVTNHYGEFDKSPGIKGIFRQSDHMAFLRNLFGFFLQTTQQAAGGVATSLIQREAGNVMSVQVPTNSQFMKDWIDGVVNPNQLSDTVFVQIPAMKPAWILNTSIVEPRLASKGAQRQKPKDVPESELNQSSVNQVLSIAKKRIEAATLEKKDLKDENDPNAYLK